MTDRGGAVVRRWWNDYEPPQDTWARWRVGPLTFYARRSPKDWRFAWRSEGDPLDPVVKVEIPSSEEPDAGRHEYLRFTMSEPGIGLHLSPRLANLPCVVRPEMALRLPRTEHALLYVSTGVWLAVQLFVEKDVDLLEIPVYRPSDTWFGSDTRSGQLCYASRTSARTSLEHLDRLSHRAITPVEIINRGQNSLTIEQLRIPVTALSLYESAEGNLWTDAVSYVREADEESASLEVLAKSGHLPQERTLLAEPRAPMEEKTVVHAFSRLFK